MFRVELPGPKVSDGVADDARIRLQMPRAMFGVLAEEGELDGFPGVSAPFDPPSDPDLVLHTAEMPVDACVDSLMELLEARGFLRATAE